MTGARPTEIVEMLGVRAASLRFIQESGNAHWSVRRDTGEYVILRRFRAGQSEASVTYEHDVVRHLHARGWPVAPPVAGPIEVGGRWWALYPRLPGRRQRWAADDPRHRWRGELLARLHLDTAPLVALGQRDGWHRRDEASELTPEHVTLLARLRRLDRPRAVAFERHARQIAEGVAFLRTERFPTTVVHGDFMPWNLHTRGDTLVAVFDFEAAHCDSRAADVAFASWGGRSPAVFDGYANVAPLSEEEEAALPLLWRAGWLSWGWTVLARTRDRVEPELDAVLEKLARPWGA